ncbi:Histone-like DNA-binding protein (plasmid) [Bradyrhizobium sp. BTAi1]|nr:Histone-like DNA-binding protein [Bradyrhizobium sp. BTAi1]
MRLCLLCRLYLFHGVGVRRAKSKQDGARPMTTANEIAEKIAAENDLTKAQAKTIVDSVFKAIADAAVSGAETSLPGFGKFKVKDSPAREGRNPSTGATIAIAASRKLTFTPAKAIKDSLNGGTIPNDGAS